MSQDVIKVTNGKDQLSDVQAAAMLLPIYPKKHCQPLFNQPMFLFSPRVKWDYPKASVTVCVAVYY